MKKTLTAIRHLYRRMERMERKCDIILSQLAIIRRDSNCRRDEDATISRLLDAAMDMQRFSTDELQRLSRNADRI